MNTFGRIFKVSVFGESHGESVGLIMDGIPPGIKIADDDFNEDLERRKGLHVKGTTPRKEKDVPLIQSGVYKGYSTGTPLAILFENNNIRSEDYEKQRSTPRPGHADFVAHKKYKGFEDFRGGGHFSARLTTGIVAAGVIAKKILQEHLKFKNIEIKASIINIGGYEDLEAGLNHAIAKKDSVGGIIQVRVRNLPIGIGEPFWDGLDSLLAAAMFAIPAVKGVEIGAGFQSVNMLGSEHNDQIINKQGATKTNHAGGIVGGISNGNDIVFQVVVKPTSSTPAVQESWNWDTQSVEQFSVKGRHDLCVALRAPVIMEAMTAIVLADAGMVSGMFLSDT